MAISLRHSFAAFRFSLYYCVVILTFIGLPGLLAAATQVTLAWDANSEPDVAGYRLYARQADGAYDYNSPAWEGSKSYCTLYDLEDTVGYCFVVHAYDTNGNECSDSNEICKTEASTNQNPIADAGPDQYVEAGSVVSLKSSNSIDLDDGIASFQWKQVNGLPVEIIGDATEPDVTFVAAEVEQNGESLTFKLTLTDFGGLQASDTCIISVTAAGEDEPSNAGTIHIGDLEGTSNRSRWFKWKAAVNIEIHASYCELVNGATVSGRWTGGYNGSGSCVSKDGICTVTSGDIYYWKNQADFIITNISSPNLESTVALSIGL